MCLTFAVGFSADRPRGTTGRPTPRLQRELAKMKGVVVEASSIRRLLVDKGYKWIQRGKKPISALGKESILRHDRKDDTSRGFIHQA